MPPGHAAPRAADETPRQYAERVNRMAERFRSLAQSPGRERRASAELLERQRGALRGARKACVRASCSSTARK